MNNKNLLFLGTTGIYHTLIAAHLYVNKAFPADFTNLKYWGDLSKENWGYPLFLDQDEHSNKIYSLGVGLNLQMSANSIQQLVRILGCSEQDLIVKPIFIKRERLLYFFHRISRFKLLKFFTLPIIIYLLRFETTYINQQVAKIIN
ncbi:MAG: DUF3189 family protein [Syntrophomonas sp.]|nr:DUF3189 family protein [Syntrophomonas sp.]